MSASGVSFVAADASSSASNKTTNNTTTDNSNIFDSSTVFAPASQHSSSSPTSAKYSHTLVLSQAGVQQKTELKFDWNTTQENLFGTLVDQVVKALAMNATSKQAVTLMASTHAVGQEEKEEEVFPVFGDTQLRALLLSTDPQTKIKMIVGARRRSVLSQAVEVTCKSGLSGDSFGQAGVFRFRFLPDNAQLLSDFKAECMDTLDLFGAEEDSFDLHHIDDASSPVPILSSHSLERLLNSILARADEKNHKITFKMVPASATLIGEAAPDDSGRVDRAGDSTVNAEDLFAPTSIRDWCRTFAVTNGETGAKVNMTFTWTTHQDGMFQEFCAEIKKALKLDVNESQQALSLTATVDGESFAIFGDNQLRGMLASVPESTPISISTSTRRRSVGSVLSRAVQITALSALSGEAHGETAVFRFRFLPENATLLSDFKCECMDALDLFGSDEKSFDIHIKNDNANDYVPILSSHALERRLNEALKVDAVITNVDVKLVPASATNILLAAADDSGRDDRVDADNLFNASTADGMLGSMTTKERLITAVSSATGAKADITFEWSVEQENLYGILCDKIAAALNLNNNKASNPQHEAMTLTATVSDESFPIYGDNQLRNLLASIPKNEPLKFTVGSRRRSVGSVMARSLMCSCLNNIESLESTETATFRFRYLPDDTDNVLSLFKCEVMDALDLFGAPEESFDVQIKSDKSWGWASLTTAAALKAELDDILARNDAAMIIPFRVIAAPTYKPAPEARNSPSKVHVSLGDVNSSKSGDFEADLFDPHLLQSLTSAAAGVFHLSTASAIRLFGVTDDGARREIVDDDTARAALAERLHLIAIAALSEEQAKRKSISDQAAFEEARRKHEEEEEKSKAKTIKIGVSLSQYLVSANNNNNTTQAGEEDKQSDVSSSVPQPGDTKIITFDHEVATLAARADQNGSLHELRKACAKQINLDLFAGDTLELYVQTSSATAAAAPETLELTQDKHLTAAVISAQEAAAGTSEQQQQQPPILHIKYKGSLHPSRRNRFITIKATELQKRGVDYVEVVDNVFEFSPITVNPNLINELRSVVARSLKNTIALRHIQMSEINDQKNPYILEANLDTEWINVSSNKAAHAMLRALTENSAGHLSLRIKPPVPPPQDWEIALTVFFRGEAFRHNVVFVEGTTADFQLVFTELKKLCDVPFDKLDTVTLDEALPATRSDRQIRDDAALTRIFNVAIAEKAFPETFRRSVLLRIEDIISVATINAERSESDKRKLRSVFYTASFQGAASIHPQDGRVDVDINKKQNILADLKDLLLDNLRVPRLSGDEIGIFIATAGSSSAPQHMMNDQQLVDFLNLVGDDNSAENRLQIIFRSSKATTTATGNNNNNAAAAAAMIGVAEPSKSSPNFARAEIIQDIANCWSQLSGGSSNIINMEDVRITFTTWTDGATLDPQQTALKRFNEVSSWAPEVTGKENLIPVLREMVAHLSDFALANFRAHARDMANFVEDVSSASKSSRMLATAFRAYAVDGLVTREFLLRGLVDSDLASSDKAESVLSAYGESLNEEDFVEVLSYFVGDDSLVLHKILCAAAPKRPQWVGSPRRDEEVSHRHETRLRIELRHVMDYLHAESFVSFFSTFNPETGINARKQQGNNNNVAVPTKQQNQAIAVRGIAWCLACLLQHSSASATTTDDKSRSIAVVSNNNNNTTTNHEDFEDDHEASWIWFKNFVSSQENAETFLNLLRTTERVPVSRNTLALVASRLLSRDLEKGSLLAISSVVAQLGQWCTLVLQLSCLTRDISYPPEFIPSQPDFETLAAKSPRARKIVDKNTAASAPRQTEAYQLAGVAPPRPGTSSSNSNQNSPRKIVASTEESNNNNNSESTPQREITNSNGALAIIPPSPPNAPSPSNGRRSGASARYYQPRYASSNHGSYGLTRSNEQTLEEVLRSAAETKNAAAGAVMQTKLGATHFLFTIACTSDFAVSAPSAATKTSAIPSGSIYIVVLDDSKGEKKEIFRTPATTFAAAKTEFAMTSARFLVPISGPAMAYIFQIRTATKDDKVVAAARWAASRTGKEEDLDDAFIRPANDMLALKFTSANEDGRLGSAPTNGNLIVMLTHQKELAAIPKDPQHILHSMIQVTLDSIVRGHKQQQQQQQNNNNRKNNNNKKESASSDSDEDPDLKINGGGGNDGDSNEGAFYIRAINELGDTVFTLGKQQGSGSSTSTSRVAVVELERVLPYVTLQRVPQTVGSREDDVTDCVDITATKFVASRTIEESLKPVVKFVPGEVEKEGYSVLRDGPPLVLTLSSIGFDRVAPPAPKDEAPPVAAITDEKKKDEDVEEM